MSIKPSEAGTVMGVLYKTVCMICAASLILLNIDFLPGYKTAVAIPLATDESQNLLADGLSTQSLTNNQSINENTIAVQSDADAIFSPGWNNAITQGSPSVIAPIENTINDTNNKEEEAVNAIAPVVLQHKTSAPVAGPVTAPAVSDNAAQPSVINIKKAGNEVVTTTPIAEPAPAIAGAVVAPIQPATSMPYGSRTAKPF